MSLILIDEVKIGGLPNYNVYNKLNLVDISIRDSELNSFLLRYNRRYKYLILLDNTGNLIEFVKGEDKVPVLNFNVQVII